MPLRSTIHHLTLLSLALAALLAAGCTVMDSSSTQTRGSTGMGAPASTLFSPDGVYNDFGRKGGPN